MAFAFSYNWPASLVVNAFTTFSFVKVPMVGALSTISLKALI